MKYTKFITIIAFYLLTMNYVFTNDDNKPDEDKHRDSLAGYDVKSDNTNSSQIKNSDKNDEEFKYWITKSSGKRHNKSCRYYKSSNGRGTNNQSEGKECRICGS